MPEPDTAVQGGQDANIATAPQAPADKPTTTQKSEVSDHKGVMDWLDIPAEVQAQVAPKIEEKPAEPEKPQPEPEKPEETPPEPEVEPQVDEPDEDEADEQDEQEPAAAQGQKPDKRQKRINRLTRKLHGLEGQLDVAIGRIKELEGTRAQPTSNEPYVPSATPLAHIRTENQLNSELAKARSIVEWCDSNPEGVGLSTESIDKAFKERFENGQLTEEEALGKSVAKWRRDSQKVIIDSIQRRDEIRAYGANKQHFDGIARQVWPELFDNRTEEYQTAQTLLDQFPSIKASPQANYAIGLVIEGARSLQGRIAQAKNGGPAKQHRDISERVFEPRVPLAPHTAEPPTREVVPSSQKRLNEAMSNLVKDTDGSSSSLAAAFAAMDQAQRTRAGSRTPVRV